MAAATTATARKLVKVGFSPRTAAALRVATIDHQTAIRSGALTTRQSRTLQATPLTMTKLLKGGFTRPQAKLILGL